MKHARGAPSVEDALLFGLISIAAAGAATLLGGSISGRLSRASRRVVPKIAVPACTPGEFYVTDANSPNGSYFP
jgi:Flp pilus assembly pilin Flp